MVADSIHPAAGKVLGAIIHHPGETVQVVGLAIDVIPFAQEVGTPVAIIGNIVKHLDGEVGTAVPITSAPKWKVGGDIYSPTTSGKEPNWSTVRSRYWKNAAAGDGAADMYGAGNISRMQKGLAPQRYNADKGGIESMELSHEPVPSRDGGKEIVPRWPKDHAAQDPYRRPGY